MFFFRSKVDGLLAGASLFFVGLSAVPAGVIAQSTMPAPPTRIRVASEAVTAAFRRADSDGDGLLTREESAHLPAIYAQFDELDVNHDGVLTIDEFDAWLSRNN
jgi:EF hand